MIGRAGPRQWRNWVRTASCTPERMVAPTSVDEVTTVLATAARQGVRAKVVGSGHSFNDIATTDGVLIDLSRLGAVLEHDETAATVTVQGGTKLRRIIDALAARGRALENLGDVSYQSIAGAIATGTHGSGIGHGPLSSQVVELRLALADGSVVSCSREERPDLFGAALTGLGALGVVVEVTLRTVPAFDLQPGGDQMSFEELSAALEHELESNEHFDLMYDFNADVWIVRRFNRVPAGQGDRGRVRAWFDDVVVGNGLYGIAVASSARRPERLAARTGRLPASTRADRADRSDRVFTAPRRWRLFAAEYSVPVEDALRLTQEVGRRAAAAGVVPGFPLFVRFVAPDESYLGPSHGRRSAFICPIVVSPLPKMTYMELADEVLRPAGARPHWGKWHRYGAAELEPLYPQWGAFQDIRAAVDPSGLFQNDYLARVLGAVRAPTAA